MMENDEETTVSKSMKCFTYKSGGIPISIKFLTHMHTRNQEQIWACYN